MINTGTTYLLWLAGWFGFSGLHRFYLGKPVSGVLYLLTWGFFGIGQLIDLFRIQDMVAAKNAQHRALHEPLENSQSLPRTMMSSATRLDVQLLRVCQNFQGATISECVIETGESPSAVKETIHHLCREGLLLVDNREGDGAVIYRIT